ncbi:MAG: T9SS type A sorting domain-containing protein, partial [Ignavibacteriales bacterium]|nr:T9SS type A sorting domain-containing protein [Ignavibacteriales bacterium]
SGEEGLAGEPVTVTPQPSGTPITVQTDANGAYSVCDLGPGSYVVTAAKNPPADWQTTQPTNGSYSLTSSSGVDLAGNDFGNFRLGDTVKYRSFGSDDLSCGTPTKPVKRPKPGKPILPPNMANVLQEIYLQGGTITVGLSGQLNAGGKEKAWLGCAKFGGVLTTLCKKGVEHPDNVYRGLDFGNNGKPLLKRYKALPATIQGNDLLEDMVVMAVNIAASDYGKTTPGYGDLIYVEAGNPYDGKTLRQIKAAGDALMTNWEFHTLAEFQTIHDVIEKCNEAFRVCPTCETPDPLDTVTWMVGAKLKLTGVRSVFDVPFLRGNPGIVPVTHDVPVELPTVYALGQNYPNPFNPTTSIQFDLPEASTVTLTIYNMLGQEVATLLNHESFDAGQQEVDFDASSLSSGVYLYRLSAQAVDDDGNATGATFSQVKKMVLLK